MKHLRYLWYLTRHKWYVLQEGVRLGVPLHQLLIHDWSKLLPSEWLPYVEHFYGSGTNTVAYHWAWVQHYNRQPHHWQYWVTRAPSNSQVTLEIPERFLREMLADWVAASRAQRNSGVRAWYDRNGSMMAMHAVSRARLEALMDIYYGEDHYA